MVSPRFKPAGKLSTAILDRLGFDAIVSPWRTIYMRPECLDDERLRRHETAHLAQMDRDGWLRFWVLICVWYVYPGYALSPYEIEARAVERHGTHPLLKGYRC
jgi:hypothetical protein